MVTKITHFTFRILFNDTVTFMTQKHNQCQQLLCYHHVVAREDCKQNIMVMFSQSLPAAMSMQPFPKYINFTIKYQFDIYSLKLKKRSLTYHYIFCYVYTSVLQRCDAEDNMNCIKDINT